MKLKQLIKLKRKTREERYTKKIDYQANLILSAKQYYNRLKKDINASKKSIFIESYTIALDRTGKEILDSLQKKARKGIKCTVIADWYGSKTWAHDLKEYEQPNLKIHLFNPIKLWQLPIRTFINRDHRKLIVIDKKISYIGGMNIQEKYLTWRDIQLRIVNEKIAKILTNHINECLEIIIKKRTLRRPKHMPTGSTVKVYSDKTGLHRHNIRKEYKRMIKEAKKSIDIITAYLTPEKSLIRQLKKASKRGVKIRILAPKMSDEALINSVTPLFLKYLIKQRINVHLYTETFLHAKTMVVDKEYLTIGSANLDYMSLHYNHETNIFIRNKKLAKELTTNFESLLKKATKATKKQVEKIIKNKPKYKRIIDKLIYWTFVRVLGGEKHS